jgi:thiamine pyrophosphate-dependent acetolactate synthase large subunit-like protein
MVFANRYRIPVFNSPKHFTTFPKSFTLHGGAANFLTYLSHMRRDVPDLVLLLGARTGMFLGGRSGAIIPSKSCKLIQVDLDGSEIGRTLPVDLGVISDVTTFLAAVNRSPDPQTHGTRDENWISMLLGLQRLPSPFESDPERSDSGNLHPYHALKRLLSAAEKNSILVLDGGEASSWALNLAPLCEPSTVIFATGYLGFLGTGFGYALGCSIADPNKKIIHIQGDGSAGFHFMELDTYRRFNLNIMTVVVNNSCWGMSLSGQDLLYGLKIPNRPISSLYPSTDFETVAQGLGNYAAKITRLDDLSSTVEACQHQNGPSCINLIVDRKPTHPVVAMMVNPTDDPNVIVVPYYDNLPRPSYNL